MSNKNDRSRSDSSRIDSFWGNSECLDTWLHRFNLVNQYLDGVLERCEICSEEVFFPIVNGRVDNTDYISYHARQALPSNHPQFTHEYR